MRFLEKYDFMLNTDELCKKYGITNYKNNPDGSIDVYCDIKYVLKDRHLTELPDINIHNLFGDFDCSNNKITSLECIPKQIYGSFDCSNNELTDLEFAPKRVYGDFDCSNNKLVDLYGAPEHVEGNFDCQENQLTSLDGAPEYVGGSFDCHDNQLKNLLYSPNIVGHHFKCYDNELTSLIGAPLHVGEDFVCYFESNLTTLEGAPRFIGKKFLCDGTPIYEVWKLFKDKDKLEIFNDFYDPIRDNSTIVLLRLNEFLLDIGKSPVDSVEGYTMI